MQKIVWLVVAILVFSFGFWYGQQNRQEIKETGVVQKHYAYFMQADFYSGLEQATEVGPIKEKVFGGTVSHHFYAQAEIAKLFASWREQTPEAVVIIGANHFDSGRSDVIVSEWPYETPWGLLENDQSKTGFLVKSGAAINEETPFEIEHSISTLVGFIKYYLPQTKLVPIIVKRNTSPEEIKSLVDALSGFEDVLVVASVDFSHHVDLTTAEAQDRQSIDLIDSWDTGKIWFLPPQQLDNPPALVAVLEYLKEKNASEIQLWNTNQARLSGNLDSQDITSYIFSSLGQQAVVITENYE